MITSDSVKVRQDGQSEGEVSILIRSRDEQEQEQTEHCFNLAAIGE